MALVGNTFYQSSALDPGTGYPMYYWNQTNTGLVYIRNAADNAWILVGDSNQPYLGQLSTQGGNMNGAVTGAHGLAPATVNDFTSNLYKAGAEVATKIYVDAQDAALSASIATSVSSALASVSSLNVSARVARSKGTWSATGTSTGNVIPLPAYSDGVVATEAECVWGAYLMGVQAGYFTAESLIVHVTETANRVYTISAYRSATDGGTHSQDFPIQVGWFITAFRST